MIIKPGIHDVIGTDPDGRVTGTTRLCGFDAFYGLGSLTPNTIGEREIVSLFWRDDGYCQLVVRGDAPEDLFEKIVIALPTPLELVRSDRRIFSATVHGDSCWVWTPKNPGAHGGDFDVGIS